MHEIAVCWYKSVILGLIFHCVVTGIVKSREPGEMRMDSTLSGLMIWFDDDPA
jgi:hypothetical protein